MCLKQANLIKIKKKSQKNLKNSIYYDNQQSFFGFR
jgi:hypothetical protein